MVHLRSKHNFNPFLPGILFKPSKTTTLGFVISILGFPFFASGGNLEVQNISQIVGKGYFQPLHAKNLPPSLLSTEKEFSANLPFAIGTTKDSFVELIFTDSIINGVIRLGRNSALQINPNESFRILKGSLLCSHREFRRWKISSSDHIIEMEGAGTWLLELQHEATKFILLEGEISIGNLSLIHI